MSKHITTTCQNGVLEIAINRPDRRNAITSAMYAEMAEAIATCAHDSSVGVILIRGEGGAFTAGNDLADFVSNPPTGQQAPAFDFMRSMITSPKIIVAAVTGLAVGIGTTMLLHCDLVVAGRSAKLMAPFVNIGLTPEFASSRLLPAAMGRQRAARHLLLCEVFDAATAEAFGIVSQVTEDENVLALAREYASQLLAKPPSALARTKALINSNHHALLALIAREAETLALGLNGPEFAEAADAFFNKRPANFARAS